MNQEDYSFAKIMAQVEKYQEICQRLKFSPPSKGSKTLFGQLEKLYKNTGTTITTEQIKLAKQFLFILKKYGDYYYDSDLERRYYVTCKGRIYVLFYPNFALLCLGTSAIAHFTNIKLIKRRLIIILVKIINMIL